jgi:hypothetical protein
MVMVVVLPMVEEAEARPLVVVAVATVPLARSAARSATSPPAASSGMISHT